jgi:hypothetical protein
LEADVPRAADAMLKVLEYCERRDETTGRIEKLGNIADLGKFLYFVWRRVARYGYDRTQSSEAHQWTFYRVSWFLDLVRRDLDLRLVNLRFVVETSICEYWYQ